MNSLVSNYNLDILCLSETWEKSNNPLNFRDWSTLSKPRKNNEGHGGVAIISKPSEDFYITRRKDLEKDNLEAICADIVLRDRSNFLLVVVYIPPNQKEQMKLLTELIRTSKSKNIIITGDLNAKSHEWNNNCTNECGKQLLEEFLHDSHYVCTNDGKPTRRNTTSVIDLFITNPELVPKVSLCETLTYESVQSDHIGVLLALCENSESIEDSLIEKYLLMKTDWKLWEECTNEAFRKWNSLCEQTDWESVEDMYASFKTVFDECRDKSVPKRSVKSVNRRKKPPWWNERMNEVKKCLNKAKRTYKRHSTEGNFIALQSIETEFKKAEEEEKDKWVKILCDKITYSSTPKEMWDSFKSLTSYQDLDGGNVLPLLDRDNNPVFEYEEKSEILQETFFSGNHLSENDFDEKFKEEIETELSGIRQKQEDQIYDDAFLNSKISLGETIAALQYLKEGKAAGPDIIFTDLLLHANEELEKSIHKLFTFSFKTGTLPQDWKTADVKFLRISGKSNYHIASAYRPISLTSCLGKCLERILTVRLNGFIEHNNIIDGEQEGLRKFHSTTSALLRLVQGIYNGFNNKENTLAAFIDLEKAFNSVWRDGLLVKLHRFGIRGRLWKWIEGFLSDR